MRSSEHIGIGIIAFLGYAYVIGGIVSTINDPWIWGGLAVVIGSIIPDWIEPATNFQHRGLFHSIGSLKAVGLLFGSTALIALIIAFFSTFSAFYIISCFFLGYFFHLLADSITPMGLPR
ncbi:metal-dependent hydrolase [Methanoregula sp.]|uniref:metal-dependent hydrolase n=1 Tax=Methanoregula sp. TaxID=2052170 RepID=UPI00236A8360|nr:metal-dependent hydrolase [Methanoregula sp.]MDD1686830.1 metal-dependent hydrolase [Methanoregula sp.]